VGKVLATPVTPQPVASVAPLARERSDQAPIECARWAVASASVTEPAYVRVTRTAYDTVAVSYEALLRTELARKPFDRAMLGAFAELVHADGNGQVADLGCGPGRVTAHLDALGLHAFGVDLSPAMVAVARERHPHLRFDVGSMSALDMADGVLAGVVAWYSIIHIPPSRLPDVFEEFHRVLAPGGYLLLAFQAGDACVHLEQAYGHEISLDAYRLSPEIICERLSTYGLVVEARLLREPDETEKIRQAYVVARKPADA
jgi:SAM-dependent methyltransferase